MRESIFLFLALLLTIVAQGRERTAAEMRQIAMTQLGLSATTRASSAELKRMYTGEKLSIYGTDKVFVVVSSDTQFTPVLGYSDTSFDSDNLPANFRWWLARITASMKNGYVSSYTPTRSTLSGSYFCTAEWGQESPYNQNCPKSFGRSGSNLYTGCVATAMSQIMYYYKYPATGSGTDCTYTVVRSSSNKGTTYSRSFNSTYDWSNMIDDYTSQGTTAQQQAVATLMFDAGTAVHMQYASDGSGAFTNDAASAFVENFGYDSLSVNYLTRLYYSDEEWMSIIDNEISNGRPILYSGVDATSGGHAFVFDGIDDNGLVHINWGWDGDANGFYDIADLEPDADILSTTTDYHFNLYQDMVIGLKNHANADAEDKYHSQWVSDSIIAYTSPAKNSLSIELADMWNMDFQTFEGTISALFINQSTGDTTTCEFFNSKDYGSTEYYSGYTLRNSTDGTVEPLEFDLKSDLGLPAGTYKVCLASQSEKQSEPTVLRIPGGESSAIFTYAEDGTVAFGATTGISSTKAVTPAVSSDVVCVYDITGRLVYVSKASSFQMDDIPGQGLFVIRQGDSTQKVIKK
jgi:hypothetical protein